MKLIGNYDVLSTVKFIGEDGRFFTKDKSYPIVSIAKHYAVLLDNDNREHSVGKQMMVDEFVQVVEADVQQMSADETVQELKEMLAAQGHPNVIFIGSVENVYVFDDMDVLQKVIVHHDPVYDCGNIYFKAECEEYFL